MESEPLDDNPQADELPTGDSRSSPEDREVSDPATSGHSDADSQTQRNIDDESPG